MPLPTREFDLELGLNEVGSIPATGVHRFVVAEGSPYLHNYMYGFGATQPTKWSEHKNTENDGFNVPDDMGTMWIWNTSDNELKITVHRGA